MGWARLDDRWHDHHKVAAAGLEAAGLWTMCLTWAHSNRRTTTTPGVIPQHIVTRFAGTKAKKLAKVLVDVGLWDAPSSAGWPIHDFDDYLPRYDPEQARAAGSAGGKARSGKRTAKQTASEPLDGLDGEPPSEPPPDDEAVRQANEERTSSTRASARRNPDPGLWEELRSSQAAEPPPPTAQLLVREWIDLRGGVQPDSATLGHAAREMKRLLGEGIPYEDISAALPSWHAGGLPATNLKTCVDRVRTGVTVGGNARPAAQITRNSHFVNDPNADFGMPPKSPEEPPR